MADWQDLWQNAAIDEATIDDREQLAAAFRYADHFGDRFYRQVVALQIASINESLAAA